MVSDDPLFVYHGCVTHIAYSLSPLCHRCCCCVIGNYFAILVHTIMVAAIPCCGVNIFVTLSLIIQDGCVPRAGFLSPE